MNETIMQLYRERPRSSFVRGSVCVMSLLIMMSWLLGNFFTADLFNARRVENLRRFLQELIPYPLQGRNFDWKIACEWFGNILSDRGLSALNTTMAMSVAAIVLAGAGSILFTFLAARNLSTPEPFLQESGRQSPGVRAAWPLVATLTRLFLIFVRSIPEYVWAFLFLAIFGISAWPIVLALALHNLGILGKLSAEIIENLPSASLSSLRGLGASRVHIAGAAIFPMALPRFLMFFFYRWETCVREATVLGMLGFVSLGFWIQDARARNAYDEMFILILLGAALIMIGDIISTLARSLIRNK